MKQPQIVKIKSLTSLPSLTTLNRYANGLGLVLAKSAKVFRLDY
ncbi:hypothetical protein [Lactobacillus phage JNU_P5]|nr:hypothetical protein [Lactobacillus phage JNU_P5]